MSECGYGSFGSGGVVSVVIPCWGAKYRLLLRDALRSVFLQSYKPIEVEVVVEENNVSRAMNLGAKKTFGDFLVFLGADDFLSSVYVEKCLSVVRSNTGFVYTACRKFGAVNEVAFPDRNFKRFRFYYRFGRSFGGQLGAMLIRREAFESVGGFDENSGFEDWDLAIRVLKAGWDFEVVDEPIHFYRVCLKDKSDSWRLLCSKYPEFRFWSFLDRFVYKFAKRRVADFRRLLLRLC